MKRKHGLNGVGPVIAGLLVAFAVGDALAQSRGSYEQARRRLVEEAVVGAGVTDERVVRSMLATPRHEFVPPLHRQNAYYDMALPIGDQQTISSPFIVAFMTEALDPQPTDRVLEIGTGSGYQAAILSPLVDQVYTIEIVESLGRRAERTLNRLRYDNVYVKVGDGFKGWPENAPFDKIIVTCSPERVPEPLVEQLKEGGLMVVPVGERYQQTLYLMRKRDGQLEAETLRPTLFVPMTGQAEDGRQVRPDPSRPRVINGGFEAGVDENGFVNGWYYQRQLTWERDSEAPEGEHYVTFSNLQAGRASHVLQGFPIDGQQIGQLELSAWIKTYQVRPGLGADELPRVAITFYDDQRRPLSNRWLGPFRGTQPWRQATQRIRVPAEAREGILRLGLFGATGEVSFDDIQMTAVGR